MARRVVTKLTHNLVITLALATVVIFSMVLDPSPRSAPTAPAADSPAALGAAHGCWSREAPADMQGIVPGHVVVTLKGEVRLGGAQMVTKALEQVFEGVDHGLVVHAFCR